MSIFLLYWYIYLLVMPGHIILTKFKIMPQLLRSDLMKLVSMRMILGLCRKTLKNNFLVFCEQFLSTNRSKSLDFCILGKILCKCDIQSQMFHFFFLWWFILQILAQILPLFMIFAKNRQKGPLKLAENKNRKSGSACY